jgi:hypothetical protein
MFESTLPRRIESADAVAFRDFFQGTKKVDLFFFLSSAAGLFFFVLAIRVLIGAEPCGAC